MLFMVWLNSVQDHLAHGISRAILGKNGVLVYWFCSAEFAKQVVPLSLHGFAAPFKGDLPTADAAER